MSPGRVDSWTKCSGAQWPLKVSAIVSIFAVRVDGGSAPFIGNVYFFISEHKRATLEPGRGGATKNQLENTRRNTFPRSLPPLPLARTHYPSTAKCLSLFSSPRFYIIVVGYFWPTVSFLFDTADYFARTFIFFVSFSASTKSLFFSNCPGKLFRPL